ncbi:Polyribonucleotide nucleotidyltransferase [Trema orientale]|uniref:Polyribonucleotide nucleotidyltransferase n=1 Tax=Trema orientale TaxID=63057 RepID=A0A2P5DDP1_TREOI|nr:Polyribonucleotide nucleotidyltransferase [Trema orientale]
MAEEEVAAAGTSPAPLDHKRKLEDLEPQAPGQPEPTSDELPDSNAELDEAGEADGDEAEPKRPRLDDKPDVSASENGHQEEEKEDEPAKEVDDQPISGSGRPEEAQPPSEEATEEESVEKPSADGQQLSSKNVDGAEESSKEETQEPSSEDHQQQGDDSSKEQQQLNSDNETISRRMEVPNNKVGVLIGKAGDTIRYLQYNSGAKIQITRDVDADPYSTTRPVEIIGTLDNINKAEKLISAVIAEADAGGSPSLVARGLANSQAASATEQIQIQVPNEKVGLIIGRGGETIKGLQTRSGARIQLIPQHLPDGDESKERTVRVTGDKRQIEIAREMIKDVMNQTVRPSSLSSGFNQQGYRPRGPPGPQWGPRGSHMAHPTSYDYQQRGPYQSHNPHYPPSYGGYSQQMGPRSGYSSGWEQRPPPSMQGHGGGYDYYSGQKGHLSDTTPGSAPHSASIPLHAPGPSPNAAMGPPQSQANYNYGQPHGPDYGQPAPYSQSAHPQQSYGHGYDDHAPTQHPYGSSQQVYPHGGAPTGYGQQQQYGKPSYGVPSQGPPPQSYGPPRPSQPGEVPYQGSAQAQSYGQSVPPQQPYPCASSGQTQQAYPSYGSAPAADGYSQPQPASGSGYPQQGGQPVASYGQPGSQQSAAYTQVAPTAGYGQYPTSQQGYPEQSAPNSAGYGYQGHQDPGYGTAAPASAYGAPTTAQAGYAAQPAQTQQSYDQTVQQSGAYGVQPSTSVGYGKTVSPQPGYAQYDSSQMYAAPH